MATNGEPTPGASGSEGQKTAPKTPGTTRTEQKFPPPEPRQLNWPKFMSHRFGIGGLKRTDDAKLPTQPTTPINSEDLPSFTEAEKMYNKAQSTSASPDSEPPAQITPPKPDPK